MSSPESKDVDYQKFKTDQALMHSSPKKRGGSGIDMDALGDITPLRKSAKISEDVDVNLKKFVGRDVIIPRKGAEDATACVILVYKVGNINMMRMRYLNEHVIIYSPAYEFVQDYSGNQKKYTDYLVVFSNEDRTLCYKYFFTKSTCAWTCCGCDRLPKGLRKRMTAKVGKENEEEYVKLLRTCHECKPFSYASIMEKAARILKEPYYEIIEAENGKKTLFVYSKFNEDEYECEGFKFYYTVAEGNYRCSAEKCNVRATVIQNKDESVIRLNGEHSCQARQLHDLKVEIPNYVRKEKNHIFIFSPKNSNMGYDYYYNSEHNIHQCTKCKSLGRVVSAKLIQDKEGDYLRLSKLPHICKTFQYVPDIDKSIFFPITCPKEDEGIAEIETLDKKLEVHREAANVMRAVCYVVTVVKDGTIQERYSGVGYIGYSENEKMRLQYHRYNKNSPVSKLLRKYGVVHLVPIYESICARAYDVEAAGIELRRQGSLDFHFVNEQRGHWKSAELREICEDKNHPEHEAIALAFKRMVLEALKKTEHFISSFAADGEDSD
uniref:Uncharacterized protein n=1 Tax=Panagrolaimus sp. ES5 TaxID=591445 RepID=A0AC34G2B8_9BILA